MLIKSEHLESEDERVHERDESSVATITADPHRVRRFVCIRQIIRLNVLQDLQHAMGCLVEPNLKQQSRTKQEMFFTNTAKSQFAQLQ